MNSSLALESITASSLSILSAVSQTTSAPPFAPSSLNPARTLLDLRANIATLAATLDHIHTLSTARRKAVPVGGGAEGDSEDKDVREARLMERVDELRGLVEQAREKGEIQRRVGEALESSWLVGEALKTAPEGETSEERERIKAKIKERDRLSFQLLDLRAKNEKAAGERTKTRQRMFPLTRENASLAKELRETDSREDAIVDDMPKELRKKYQRIKHETVALVSRHSIIRNVFQLVVAESGIPWYTGDSVLPAEEDGGGSMSTAGLQRLMLEAGESKDRQWDEEVGENEEPVEEEDVEGGDEDAVRVNIEGHDGEDGRPGSKGSTAGAKRKRRETGK